jgi:hypothetical protein
LLKPRADFRGGAGCSSTDFSFGATASFTSTPNISGKNLDGRAGSLRPKRVLIVARESVSRSIARVTPT